MRLRRIMESMDLWFKRYAVAIIMAVSGITMGVILARLIMMMGG